MIKLASDDAITTFSINIVALIAWTNYSRTHKQTHIHRNYFLNVERMIAIEMMIRWIVTKLSSRLHILLSMPMHTWNKSSIANWMNWVQSLYTMQPCAPHLIRCMWINCASTRFNRISGIFKSLSPIILLVHNWTQFMLIYWQQWKFIVNHLGKVFTIRTISTNLANGKRLILMLCTT